MRFSAIHKLSSYLVVLAAVAGLLLSPEISPLTTALTLVGIGLSWFAEPSRYRLDRFTAAWNIVTVVVFVYLAVGIIRGGAVITSGASFLLFVLINKLFNRRTSKDYQQAYVVSFLILVVATTLNTNISYAICFALFVVFATWALTLLHLRREMEENYLLKHSDGAQSEKVEVERILNSRRIVGGAFLGGTSLISVGVIVVAALVFTLFPRIGFGLFLGHRRGGIAVVGFSERVQLGHHGTVRDNPQVVMRVVFPGVKRPTDRALYWRGSAFDHYRAGEWSHGGKLLGHTAPARPEGDLYLVNHAPGIPVTPSTSFIRDHLLRQEIYLEPLSSTVIFGADRPVALEVPRPAVGGKPLFVPRRGPLGEIRASKMRTSGVRYTVYSWTRPPSPSLLRRSPPFRDPRWSRFVQLPETLPRRVGALARKVAGNQPTVYDKVIAVRDYLRKSYAYTLNLTHDPALDPVDEFLFVTRRGHCEYFASAMTLMLRHLGIHARNVNGFAGGAWNEVGNYLAVRQGDAHAWVEVLFAGVGWVAFDPTPSGARRPSTGTSWLGRVAQLWDTMRLRWFRYVVEYDLGKQVSLFRGVGRLLHPGGKEGWLRRHWRALAGGGALLLLLAGAIHLWRRRRRPTAALAPSDRAGVPTRLYRRMLRHLARVGHVKPQGSTPQEFVEQLGKSGIPPDSVKLVDRLTRCYYQLRYAGVEADEARVRELKEALSAVQRSIPG